MYILSFASKLEEINETVSKFVDKFTNNPIYAGVIALLLFAFIFIGVSSFTRK